MMAQKKFEEAEVLKKKVSRKRRKNRGACL